MHRNPFSAGRWVCGEHFYGRNDLINSLLEGNESCHWVIGKRRIGKTSLLRQIERLINKEHMDKFALFWDIQGSYDAAGLFDSLYDAVEDNQDLYPDPWEKIDFELDDMNESAQLLKRLARALSRSGRRLFLLIDESEELMNVGKQDPALLSKLRRFFQTNRNVCTVMVSSPTMEQLGRDVAVDTSPFLHGFTVSYLGNFAPEECDALLCRGIDEAAAREEIFRLTNGNPFETQLVAKHYFDSNDLDDILLEMEINPTLNQTNDVNFHLLAEDERTVLKEIHCGTLPFQDFERAITVKLLRMGYLKQEGDRHVISSYFQSKWLALHLLDGNEQASMTGFHPGEVTEGIILKPEEPSLILKQIVDIYRTFIELAQNGKRLTWSGERMDLPQWDGHFIFDPKTVTTTMESRKETPWILAVNETATLLDQLLGKEETWSVYRLHQMVDAGAERYKEKDFLDLMMLIAEEAALD